jgi:hypothetical protein
MIASTLVTTANAAAAANKKTTGGRQTKTEDQDKGTRVYATISATIGDG